VANRIADRLRRYDPINWEVSQAAGVLVLVVVAFAVLESLPIGVWAGRVVMWLALAIILTVICRVQSIRYRDVATLLVPAVLLLAATSFAADATLQLISTFVIFFGAIAIPFFPRTLVAWIGFVAPDYYRSIAEDDEQVSETFIVASQAVLDQLVASEGDPSKIKDAVVAARESVVSLGPLDVDWEDARALFLRYLDWYGEAGGVGAPNEATEQDWRERQRRLDAAVAAFETLRQARSQFVGRRLLMQAPPTPSPEAD
jgi:hypothetical protein